MATDFEELRKEILADWKVLQDKKAAIAAEEADLLPTIRYYEKKTGKKISFERVENIGNLSVRPSHLDDIGSNITIKSLRDEIKDILPHFDDAEFVNANVEAVLGRSGIRPRITHELNKLAEQGVIECVHTGQGRTPSRFKVKRI